MRRRILFVALAALLVAGGSDTLAQWRPGGLMRIVILVDSSSSISPMLTDFRAGLINFLDALPGEPEIMVVSTGGQLRVRVGPTTDRQQVKAMAGGFFLDGGGNSFLDTLLEVDRRFFQSVPDRRPVFVILTTDTDTAVNEVRIAAYNKFANDFTARGGRAHGLVVQGERTGMTTRIVEHLVKHTGGYYDSVSIANAIPRVMKTLVEYAAADQ